MDSINKIIILKYNETIKAKLNNLQNSSLILTAKNFVYTDINEKKINSDTIPFYLISSIPRYILIDQNFEIIYFNAPKPDSMQISRKIDELLRSNEGNISKV